MIKRGRAIGRKRRVLFPGLEKRIRDRLFPLAKIDGSRSAKAIEPVYAQWEDAGPFRTDHWQYVFGNERPKPNLEPGRGSRCFACRARLPRVKANRCDRLEVCRFQGSAAWSVVNARRKQHVCDQRSQQRQNAGGKTGYDRALNAERTAIHSSRKSHGAALGNRQNFETRGPWRKKERARAEYLRELDSIFDLCRLITALGSRPRRRECPHSSRSHHSS